MSVAAEKVFLCIKDYLSEVVQTLLCLMISLWLLEFSTLMLLGRLRVGWDESDLG